MGGTRTGNGGRAVGKLQMKPATDKSRFIQAGFEFGCPGPEVHLGLRFKNQPEGALDGKEFPAKVWEQSPHFISADYPIELSGVKGLTKKSIRLLGTSGGQTPYFDRDDYKARIKAAGKVTAQWFVLHDTGGPIDIFSPPSNALGAHLFLNQDQVHLNKDFSSPGTATKYEKRIHHPEFRGQMIHCEILNNEKALKPNPPDVYSEYAYRAVALAYINASYRAGSWLTVTCHIEIDRGIRLGHSDPRGFNVLKLYKLIGTFVPGSTGTFGILPERFGTNINQEAFKNTFPMQYGKVENDGVLEK